MAIGSSRIHSAAVMRLKRVLRSPAKVNVGIVPASEIAVEILRG